MIDKPIRNPREPRHGKTERRRMFPDEPKRDARQAWSPWDEPMDGEQPSSPHSGPRAADDDDADPGAGRRIF